MKRNQCAAGQIPMQQAVHGQTGTSSLKVADSFQNPDRAKHLQLQRRCDGFLDRKTLYRNLQLPVGILEQAKRFELAVELPPVAEQVPAGHEAAHDPRRLLNQFKGVPKSVARVQESKSTNSPTRCCTFSFRYTAQEA